ncbi:putative O-linked N-acetylglucosamine transferase, SPINDLY family; TPR domain protein [Bradyrhizobium sp. ORS 278]|uniref:tetratricopeptide repeat protein n=1 Tax=Bradyrhizobium sp. (strain ORS 278) TaxID=114615 RepID=UPI00015086C6|nr:tetratricopeptide repeat protein [Bradyrhizobium sp. ORS 278]CAL78845.1 putative O-linked N-acetylglucosamine transferase, SPINDLY family; TPR domain protein [Bradyrhizobium sp. ORS 278]
MQSTIGSRAFQNARLQKKNRKQADGLLPKAVEAYRAGRHADAQAVCGQILALVPDHFDALHLLGASALDSGRLDLAEQALTRAVALEPRHAEAQANLGLVLFSMKRYAEARAAQERAIALKPNFVMALTSLGNTLMNMQLFAPAIEMHDRAIALKPDFADAYCNRGMAQLLLQRNDEARQSFDRALTLAPRHFQAAFGKGLVSVNLRHLEQALAAFNAALAMKPGMPAVIAQRGRLYVQMGRFEPAEADFDAALAIDPGLETALLGKAHVCVLTERIAPAMLACKRVLEQNPASEVALVWLGACFAKQGDTAGAIQHFDRALEIKPDFEDAILKKIFALDFYPGADVAVHQAVRREWWERIGARIPQRQLGAIDRDPERRITIGYVSSDFRSHSAALTFLPVLRHHDHGAFKVVCYSCSPQVDSVTEHCKAAADVWVDAVQMSDDELSDRIQADQVDILVDLSGHSAGNRLTVFARKPAPIQVTAWGNATGTGLPTMDYFFADPVTVPQAVRPLFAERVYDLPALITTDPLPDAKPTPLPMLRNGHVTFGVFNRVDKISDQVLNVWAALLRALPSARIVVKNGALDDAFLRDGLIARFTAQGIEESRLTCLGSSMRHEHIAAFAGIDISLDPFPQNGGVSTWESLQAGVPVVAKLGSSAASRAGGAIVKAIGLDDWVAEDDDGYIAIALKHAADPVTLARIRAELPDQVANSAAGNVQTYTRKVEEGYRKFWRDYCGAV